MFDLLGLDWGSKYFGMAFGSSLTGLVFPSQKVYLAENIWETLEEEVLARKTKILIIGLPTNFKFQHTEVSQKVLDFIDEFKLKFPSIEVKTVNERNTSKNWESLNTKLIHNLAAKEILELYLNK
jgi:RNase H-fold protein (predicted Holliday junction resolvase)